MRYLGIDFGLRRIGFAISDGELATPLRTIDVKDLHNVLKVVLDLSVKENIEKIIVGLPEGKLGNTVLGFINALRKRGLDVEAADETLSSKKALKMMIELNIPMKKRKVNDSTAAAIILQDYLDNQK